jgi:hypothetical protein
MSLEASFRRGFPSPFALAGGAGNPLSCKKRRKYRMKAVAVCAVLVMAEAWGMELHGPAGSVTFDDMNGAVTGVVPKGAAGPVWKSGERGLWSVRFEDGSRLDAAAFSATGGVRRFTVRAKGPTQYIMEYAAPELRVTVTAAAATNGVDLRAEVAPLARPVLGLELPARLRFAPEKVGEVLFPSGGWGLGFGFNRRFFSRQDSDPPSAWTVEQVGPAAYRRVFGGYLNARDIDDAPVALRVTDAGRAAFPAALAERLGKSRAVVNRAPAAGQADEVWVDSEHGPWLSGSRLGGKGMLWRIGAGVRAGDAELSRAAVSAVLAHIAAQGTAGKAQPSTAVIALAKGPENGIWSGVRCAEWFDAVRENGGRPAASLRSVAELKAAFASGTYRCILNPYGEALPTEERGRLDEMADAVAAYVRGGGQWVEVGGYPFHQALVPRRYLSVSEQYPPAFADFWHLTTADGVCAAVYRAQPRPPHEPWHCAEPFAPGSLACGGDERGGWAEHTFGTFVKEGETWRSPAVRLAMGLGADAALRDYAAANSMTRPLADKARPDVLAKLKRAPLLYLSGSCAAMDAALAGLPAPTLIHFADYLRGGFDKQYPDHLPPNAKWGTMGETAAFFKRARSLGHLVSPYTNPTWWCDHPRGPSFEAAGDAPLAKDLHGKAYYEKYVANDGWKITFWHPAVQTANRETVRQFTKDAPVDLLFQDQCGARTWVYDTNPAAPGAASYAEGILAMNEEDSRVVPLATECGWDHVANEQTMLCGLTWGIVPTDHGPNWLRPFKETIPADTWAIDPLALRLMHDKVIFLHHDLGQFVTNERMLAWSLALGYGMSYRNTAAAMSDKKVHDWFVWLAWMQRAVCSRYEGEPVKEFIHDRAPLFAAGGDPRRMNDDGVIRAAYGDVRLRVNLGDVARDVDGERLAPYGYSIDAPGLRAAHLDGRPAFIRDAEGEAVQP